MTRLELLRLIVGSIRRTPIKPGVVSASNLAKSQDDSTIARAKFNVAQLEQVGLTGAGMRAVRELAQLLRGADPQLARVTTLETLITFLFEFALESFGQLSAAVVADQHVLELELRVTSWSTTFVHPRIHLVACFIAPRDCGPFAVGPVHFWHISEFQKRRVSWESYNGPPEAQAYDGFLKETSHVGAQYVAQVDVPGRELQRSKEVADVVVDLALGSLQLFIPLAESRHFARVSARRLTPHRQDVVVSKDSFETGAWNRTPGLALTSQPFQAAIQQAARLLTSVGCRLQAFLGSSEPLPRLNQAWCDAAYWMHEGFAEAIDTIAVAKLETAIEVLLSASSTKLSSARLRSALKAFNGLTPKGAVFTNSPQTMEAFVQEVVETRSRVLHGTLSTLTEEAAEMNGAISSVARDHILKYTLALDLYRLELGAKDDVSSFLTWLETQRAWEWNWA